MTTRIPPALLAAMLVLPSGAAELGAVAVDRSTIAFVAHQMNVPVEGRFGRFTVQLSFDPARPDAAKASVDIELASIDAGSDDANDTVVGRDWLAVKDFPQAHFVSSAFRASGANRYEVSGKLSIKGHTHDVTAPFTFTPQGNGGAIDGTLALKRADFAIGEGSWSDFGTVANEIQVRFHIVAGAR